MIARCREKAESTSALAGVPQGSCTQVKRRSAVESRPNPRRRFVTPDPIHPITISTFCATHQRATKAVRALYRRNRGQRIVDDASRAGWSDGVEIHPFASQFRVEPRDDPIEATAQALRWDRYPDPHGEPAFGIPNVCCAALIEQTGDRRSGVMPVGPRVLSDRAR
jgi:hypothetical protein